MPGWFEFDIFFSCGAAQVESAQPHPRTPSQLAAAAAITELIFEKTVLMLLATLGISAPAATATKPAISAYSIRSWPCLSLQSLQS